MSQHRVLDGFGKLWMIGFDNPCRGFYATRFLSGEEAEETGEEADVMIGFGKGVPLDVLINKCAEHGLILPDSAIETLKQDCAVETKPLTPLQRLVFNMAEESGAFD